MTDKMAHTDDSVEVHAMSAGPTLKITPTHWYIHWTNAHVCALEPHFYLVHAAAWFLLLCLNTNSSSTVIMLPIITFTLRTHGRVSIRN